MRQPTFIYRMACKSAVRDVRRQFQGKYGSRVTFGYRDDGFTLTVFVR